MGDVDFYHYTNSSAVQKIIDTGMIFESTDGGPDAMFGTGVYGTKMTPSAGKRAIASNNWAGGWNSKERHGHVDYAFKIKIPKNKVKDYPLSNRHIYLHPGKIQLSSYQWELFEV